MDTKEKKSRYDALRDWMSAHRVTIRWASNQLGISCSMLGKDLKRETIDPARHGKLVEMRFPAELLPRPEKKRKGYKPLVPDWIEEEGRQS